MKKTTVLKTIAGIYSALICLFLFSQCSSKKSTELKNGIWRAELQREDGNNIVFNFNVKDSLGRKTIQVFNADESLTVDSIIIREDSVFIQMPFFGSHFEAKLHQGNELTGQWIIDYGSRKERMPFQALQGDSVRFSVDSDSHHDISGSWETVFGSGENETNAIGLFEQDGNIVTGTFLTPTGDYRYLQGVISGDSLRISGFDGCHAILFTAKIDENDRITDGKVFSINREPRSWHAERKEFDSLPDTYATKNIPQGSVKADFTLKDMRTLEDISIQDEKFKGKVVVVQILGSWCPNCMDETPFMIDYYNKNKHKGFEVIGVDYERTDDFDKSKKALNSFFNRFEINYPVLFSGVASSDPERTEKVFPNLPVKISAFPSSIFIDREGFIRKVHSGFSGPATGKYHEQYKEEFHGIVEALLSE